MGNYRGWFRAFDNLDSTNTKGDLYCVHIGEFSATTFTEIQMADRDPFRVNYSVSQTPFEPFRNATATINIVHNDYMEDILPNKALDTQITLYNETLHQIEWVGYITPKIFDANYTEEYETFELEAGDCLSALQYLDYQTSGLTIVSMKEILAQICNKVPLKGFYWPRSKKVGSTVVLPNHLKISEQNFFSSDTEKPWKLNEVLTEMCRYFGMTAMQWKDELYLIDYRHYQSNDNSYMTYYAKQSDYAQGSSNRKGGERVIGQEDVRSSNASISFEPVYNACEVKANIYAAEDFIPNPFDDELLTNRHNPNNYYHYYQVDLPEDLVPRYDWGGSIWTLGITNYMKKDRIKREDDSQEKWSNDGDYAYFQRQYNHKYWTSIYNGNPSTGTGIYQKELENNTGGTIVDMGVVRVPHYSQYYQRIVPGKLDFTRYICLAQHDTGWWGHVLDIPAFALTGWTNTCPIDPSSYLIINATAIFEKYNERPYINPDWLNESFKCSVWQASQAYMEGTLIFKLQIGDKYWNGTGWTTTDSVFEVALEDDDKEYGSVNKERHVLNNIDFNQRLNETGYGIPLQGVDPLGEVHFTICLPKIQFQYAAPQATPKYNAYCWLKDFSLKVAQPQTQSGKDPADNDIVYKNVVSGTNVNTLSDITVKFTTLNSKAVPSYSNVLVQTGSTAVMLQTLQDYGGKTEAGTQCPARIPEDNIVEKYVNQYSTPTKKITMDLEYQNITPFNKLVGIDVDSPNQGYVQLGTSIDYLYGRQTITAVQLK